MSGTLQEPALCVVSDRTLFHGRDDQERLTRQQDALCRAVEGGANAVQLREKDLNARHLFSAAKTLQLALRGRAQLWINDRVDIALACAADAVVLGETSLSPEVARQVCGARLEIGRSVHSVEGAREAVAQGADFLIVGTIFLSESHPEGAPAGLSLVREIAAETSRPIIGIGGITLDTAVSVYRAGASGVAVIRSILRAADPQQAAASMVAALGAAHRERRGIQP